MKCGQRRGACDEARKQWHEWSVTSPGFVYRTRPRVPLRTKGGRGRPRYTRSHYALLIAHCALPQACYHARMQKIIGVSERFDAPAPGAWELEATHMSKPLSRYMADFIPAAMTAGFRAGTKQYGLLLETMEFVTINGFMYYAARGVGAPKGAKAPPPKFIFKLLTHLHPEIRRRIRRSEEVFATKAWREDIERWDREWKPAIIRENTALQSVDARKLSNEELIAHLDACHDALKRALYMHHRLNPVAMCAIGDFLVHASQWTGLTPSELLPLMRGASAVSLGATPELQQLLTALKQSPDAMTLLASNDAHAVLDALKAHAAPVGEATRRYVDAVGIRVVNGYDVAESPLDDMPQVIVDTIRASAKGASVQSDTYAADLARIRALVPQQHQQQFDELLSEARLTYRLRDERGYMNDAWSTGITRRAILAAGERLVANGRLQQPANAFDLTHAELISALRGGPSPSAEEVAAYTNYRTTKTTADAPPIVGFAPSGPPPAEWLPPAAARMARTVEIVLGEMFAKRDGAKVGEPVRGFAASPGDVVATARLVLDSSDFSKVQAGEVLVTRATGPSYNALLPLLKGIVTDRGGTLSHAALVAREYGIPAVVGCGNATQIIPDGAKIRIDGTTGTVHVIP